ncbi:MAG: hypothetical protein HY699_00760 [Deltaproteobacteria bacterium]|nr:hypothetical protein [Deltaproteobacteria bacterium]
MTLRSGVVKTWALVAALALLSGCVRRHAPLDSTVAGGAAPSPLGDIVVPLAVRSFEISSVDGQRGVFFKLSRVPDRVASHEESEPARIVVEVEGPAAGDDIAPQSYPGADTLVSQINMSRTGGRLTLVVELSGSVVPRHSVHQMADWIMVRLNPPK